MATREEIREGIEEKREAILNFIRAWGVIKHPYGSKDAEGCLAMLSDLGLVIKVERELPDNSDCSEPGDYIHKCAVEGFDIAVLEPLIEES